MARVQKTLLRPGVYEAPQGTLRATPARLRAWADKFRQMRRSGIRVPVAWSHAPDAVPADANQRASRPYYLSRYNAGYLADMDVDPATGELRAALDVPGCELDEHGNLTAWTKLPDGRQVKTAIAEVSAAINDWRDGTGRLWPDSIIHVALTPLPVVAGQDGFRALSTTSGKAGRRTPAAPRSSTCPRRFARPAPGRPICLSLSALAYTLGPGDRDMPDMPEDDLENQDEIETPEEGTEGNAGAGADTEPVSSEGFSEAMKILQNLGLHLPPDTTPDNLLERICVAGHALTKGGEGGGDEPPATEPEPEETGGEYGSGMTTEEQRPVMMSLLTARTEGERALLAREEKRHRKEQLARIERLKKRGLPAAKAESLRQQVNGYTLSLTPEGDLVEQPVDIQLSIWDEALPRKEFTKRYLSAAVEAPRPKRDEVTDDEIKERAARVSVQR